MKPGKFIWIVYLLGAAVAFGIIESMAVKNDGTTLSRFIYDANQFWPLTGVMVGMLFGGLCVHFFWNWDPRLEKLKARCLELELELARLKDDSRTAGGTPPPATVTSLRGGIRSDLAGVIPDSRRLD